MKKKRRTREGPARLPYRCRDGSVVAVFAILAPHVATVITPFLAGGTTIALTLGAPFGASLLSIGAELLAGDATTANGLAVVAALNAEGTFVLAAINANDALVSTAVPAEVAPILADLPAVPDGREATLPIAALGVAPPVTAAV